MDFEKQKPVTREYEEGWELVFGARIQSDTPYDRQNLRLVNIQTPETYPNGCPILAEGLQGDDL